MCVQEKSKWNERKWLIVKIVRMNYEEEGGWEVEDNQIRN